MFKRDIDLVPNKANEENILTLEVGYELGGYNNWNGQYNKRGYYLYCTPSHKRTSPAGLTSVTQTVGKGMKILLKETARRSKKAENEADTLAAEGYGMLMEKVCNRYGLDIRYPNLRVCKDFEALKDALKEETLDVIEADITEYEETDADEYMEKYPEFKPAAVSWYASLIATEDLISYFKEIEEE